MDPGVGYSRRADPELGNACCLHVSAVASIYASVCFRLPSCLAVYVPRISVCESVCLSVCLSALVSSLCLTLCCYQPACLSVCVCVCVCVSVCLCLSVSVYLSLHMDQQKCLNVSKCLRSIASRRSARLEAFVHLCRAATRDAPSV